MRVLAISDTHFGAWTGVDVLKHQFALDLLDPHLEGVDEVILLGDVWDLLFSKFEHAFDASERFFDLLAERMRGKRVVFMSGNHDHHAAWRLLQGQVEAAVALGKPVEQLTPQELPKHVFLAYLERKLPHCTVEWRYPEYRVGEVVFSHGHYLDAHMSGSASARFMANAEWVVAGGRRNDDLRVEDYESVISPLCESLFLIAQLPRGTAAQQTTWSLLNRVGKVLEVVGYVSGGAKEVGEWVGHTAEWAFRALKKSERQPSSPGFAPELGSYLRASVHRHPYAVAKAVSPELPPGPALRAYDRVVRNLGWNDGVHKLVFGHTHQPLDNVFAEGHRDLRFWNTGSWIYEPPQRNIESYVEYGWPGSFVVYDTGWAEPRLMQLLKAVAPIELERKLFPTPDSLDAEDYPPEMKRRFRDNLFPGTAR